MVCGFNTETKCDGTVYHVPTEPRKGEGIETSVHIKGAVIHSLRTSHHKLLHMPQYFEAKLSELLEDQHRHVIAQVRAGKTKLSSAPGGERS